MPLNWERKRIFRYVFPLSFVRSCVRTSYTCTAEYMQYKVFSSWAMIVTMTYDKYTHMMTLIVNSRKKYENDNAKENKMHAQKDKKNKRKKAVQLKQYDFVYMWCVCARSMND